MISMVERICKVCQQPWDFRGGSTICSDECRTEWVDVLRSRAYTILITPHRKHYDLVCRGVEAGIATQAQKNAAYEELMQGRALYSIFLASANPREFLATCMGDGTE